MAISKRLLMIGGAISALISILHLILAIKPELYGVIAPGQMSTLSEMAKEGSSVTTILSAAIALIFGIWAVYAISGAGLIRSLPKLRTTLIIIGVIYVLRSLFLPTEINMVSTEDYPFRFVIYSTISLVAGLLYLVGTFSKKAIITK